MATVLWLAALVLCIQAATATERPIIGILAQEFDANSTSTYIAASYVKAVEAAGARAVPIFLRRSEDYYRDLLKRINGVVLPGGAAPWDTEGGYFQTTAKVYSIAKEMNKNGVHFPILGVCQGFEALAIASNNMEIRTMTKCKGMEGVMLPLEFKKGFQQSSLYKDASREIITTLATKNVTPNYHDWCLEPKTQLKEPWKILSVNKDADGMQFVSSMEKGNFAGVQFHPEKCAYEWEQGLPSEKEALVAARHFYDWLVNESRKNDNRFPSPKEECDCLIYNYSPLYTGKVSPAFQQTYIFRDNDAL